MNTNALAVAAVSDRRSHISCLFVVRKSSSSLEMTAMIRPEQRLPISQPVAGVMRLGRRVAAERLSREIPLKIRLMPTSIPSTQPELDGHWDQIIIARISVMIASNKTQPAFVFQRIVK